MEPQTEMVTPRLTQVLAGIGIKAALIDLPRILAQVADWKPYAASDLTLSSRGGAIWLLVVGWLSLRANLGLLLIGKSI